jgi:DNA polymerase/3'-5' exonuclease PolX
MNNLITNLKKIFKRNIIIVGSIIRKKLNPNDIDLISLLPIDDFLNILSKYYNFEILKKGKRISFIKIPNFPELNIWYVKKNEIPYSKFWLSYPKNFVSRVRHFFKLQGYKLNQYGIFEGNKQVFKNQIKNNKDFFNLLQSFGYNFKYRSPAEQQIKQGGLY